MRGPLGPLAVTSARSIRAPFRDNARHHIGGASACRRHFDEGELSVESGDNVRMSNLLPAVE